MKITTHSLLSLMIASPLMADATSIKIDGSSTVYPISEAIAEEFQSVDKKARVSVGTSGTGGGFKKFIAGEIDIANASRPIKAEEAEAAKKAGVDFVELEIATDGIAVVVNKKNPLSSITTAELKKMWEPAGANFKKHPVAEWKDVNSAWPKKRLRLYGPGTDSGTFDYFTEVVVGETKKSRDDYTASEEDNMLVNGVAGDEGGLGYFGYAYYAANKNKLKVLAVDAGKGPIAPNEKTIESGEYKPLSRPLYIYVNKKSAKIPQVAKFVSFALDHVAKLAPEVGYVALNAQKLQEMKTRWNQVSLAKK